MKEYVILFVILLVVLLIIPWAYLNSISIETKTVIDAKDSEGREIRIWSEDSSFLDVNKVDYKLKEAPLNLPDLIVDTKEKGSISIPLRGRCISACEKIDKMYLYYLTEDIIASINLTIIIEPTYEAYTYIKIVSPAINLTTIIKIDNIIEEAKGFGISIKEPKDLEKIENRENFLKKIFEKYIYNKYIRIISEPTLKSPPVREENVTRGARYIIEGEFSVRTSEKEPVIKLEEKMDVIRGGDGQLSLNLAELNISERKGRYPYLFLLVLYNDKFLNLSGGTPRLGYTNKVDELREVLESYYRWLLQGRNPIFGNYTEMFPGLLVQEYILGTDWYSLKAMKPDEKRAYIEPYIDSILKGKEELKDLKDLTSRIFWSAIASWFVNSIFVSLLLSLGIYALRRAR
jgi:hypothetical protein